MFSWLFTGFSKGHWRGIERLVGHQAVALAELQRKVDELSTKLSTTAGAALSVRIAELEAALDQLQTSNRRELGRLWKLTARDAPPTRNGDVAAADPDIAAMLALQSAPPVKPQ